MYPISQLHEIRPNTKVSWNNRDKTSQLCHSHQIWPEGGETRLCCPYFLSWMGRYQHCLSLRQKKGKFSGLSLIGTTFNQNLLSRMGLAKSFFKYSYEMQFNHMHRRQRKICLFLVTRTNDYHNCPYNCLILFHISLFSLFD